METLTTIGVILGSIVTYVSAGKVVKRARYAHPLAAPVRAAAAWTLFGVCLLWWGLTDGERVAAIPAGVAVFSIVTVPCKWRVFNEHPLWHPIRTAFFPIMGVLLVFYGLGMF
jgi:hypothetical protein